MCAHTLRTYTCVHLYTTNLSACPQLIHTHGVANDSGNGVAHDRRRDGNNHSQQQAQGHAQKSRGAEGHQTEGGGRMGPARNRGHQSRQASRHQSLNHIQDLPVKTREGDLYRSVLLADAEASTQAQPGV